MIRSHTSLSRPPLSWPGTRTCTLLRPPHRPGWGPPSTPAKTKYTTVNPSNLSSITIWHLIIKKTFNTQYSLSNIVKCNFSPGIAEYSHKALQRSKHDIKLSSMKNIIPLCLVVCRWTVLSILRALNSTTLQKGFT